MSSSFAEQLKNTPPKKEEGPKIVFSNDYYVKEVIKAIKIKCEIKNSKGIHHVKGYIHKTEDTDNEYYSYRICEILDSLPKKKDVIASSKEFGWFTSCYYPDIPADSYALRGWNGFMFPNDDNLMKMIKKEFDKLGFSNSNINFTKIEIEKTKKFLGMVIMEKTGTFGYIIDVDINW